MRSSRLPILEGFPAHFASLLACHGCYFEQCLAAVQVLQRGLPRPSAPELVAPSQPEADASTLAYEEAAEALLRHELAAMVKFDNAAYPIKVRA